ncbi:AMP-binding protein [Sporichthya sp.]|uniref:AMP-binding protein n=1 Tax=Sporichthya sp. TaxID=65475 RepID=UPI0017BEBCAA|nr:AMP-binding protein [Sporichthya sp.]MBA3742500.1 AMP-binding protein [Sporichthya sp.]
MAEQRIDVTNLRGRRAVNRYERASVGDVLERMTWAQPDKVAIIGWPGAFADHRFASLTYRQADEAANQVANTLAARGFAPGDRVMLVCENSIEAYLAKLGIAKAGMVAMPLNPNLAPDVAEHLIGMAEPKGAIVDAECFGHLASVVASTGLPVLATIAIGGEVVPGSVSFSEFIAGAATTEPTVEIHGDDIWQLLFTSGTTAMPKGVMLSHHSSHYAAMGFALSLTRGVRLECDVVLATFLPIIYHVGDTPFTYSVFLSGGTLVIGRGVDPAQMASCLETHRVTALWGGSPQLVTALTNHLDATNPDVSSLKVLVYGWGAVPPATLASLERHAGEGFALTGIFGQTEANACHRFWPAKWPAVYERTAPALNYVGIPSPILASDVVDEDGVSVRGKPGTPGEAVYRSPTVAAGYYLNQEASDEAFRDGWFHSGDSCMVDEDDLRIMVDRFKDIVKSGGENVSSIRVEAVLYAHPSVARVAVVGLPHDRWGEAVTAIVVLKPDAAATEDELIAHCRERLAGFESPKGVAFTDALPDTVGGKILKYKLRERFAEFYS